jgi:hypothetical protein
MDEQRQPPQGGSVIKQLHEHAYVAAAHSSIFARMCACGKTDVLEIREDILDHSRTYRWKAVEEPEEK